MAALIEKFFEATDTAVQVINLGAGFDTLFWRLVSEGRPVKNFIEIDFAGVTARKCMLIKRNKELMGLVAGEEADIRLSRTDLHSTRYHLTAADFTDLPSLEAKLTESEVSFTCPPWSWLSAHWSTWTRTRPARCSHGWRRNSRVVPSSITNS